jgi:hypothetical protein
VSADAPDKGAVVRDTAAGRLGEVVGLAGDTVVLEPVGGGARWTARREAVGPVSRAEALSARLRAVNDRSRRDREARQW